MDLKMMMAAELEEAILAADDARWRLLELVEAEREARAEDSSMGYGACHYDNHIQHLEEKMDKASALLCNLEDERTRRRSLSNHARLAEMQMRGDLRT